MPYSHRSSTHPDELDNFTARPASSPALRPRSTAMSRRQANEPARERRRPRRTTLRADAATPEIEWTPARRRLRAEAAEPQVQWTTPRVSRWQAWRDWLERKGFTTMWNSSGRGTDITLMFIVGLLVAFGLLMVYSAYIAEKNAGPDWGLDYLFVRQLKWAIFGACLMLAGWRIRYDFWRRWSLHILIGSIGLVAAVPLLGYARFGLARSITESGSIQPTELAKLVMILYMADWLASKGPKLRQLSFGLVPFTIIVGGYAALIVKQKLSTAVVLVITSLAMFLMAGAELKQMGISSAIAAGSFALVSRAIGYVRDRLDTFFQQFRDPLHAGVSQMSDFVRSLMAGGLFGVGLGNGVIKRVIFNPQSDSIFAVIGEEFGLVGCLLVLSLFAWLGYRGMRLAMRARDPYAMLLAFGITTWLIVQTLIHVAVITVTIPTTGIPLPFISYGGSALVTEMAGVGILLSIGCGTRSQEEEAASEDAGLWRRDRRARLPGAGSD
jgi:cell division protein FtsW